MSGRLEVVVYLKSTSELNCVINKNQGTFDFMNKSKVLLGLESGKLESGRLESDLAIWDLAPHMPVICEVANASVS